MNEQTNWFKEYNNIAALARYMADSNASADDVAYMIEKPWKYQTEFLAMRERDAQDRGK